MKIYLIIFLIISTFSMLLSQEKIEYINGTVSCKSAHHPHDLKVLVSESFKQDKSDVSIIGDYKTVNGDLIFTPTIPLQIGQNYFAICNAEKLEFQIPIPDNYRKPSVIWIYPSNDTLPSNLLKFHIEFSKPMSRIGYANVELSDENGENIERAFLKEIPELWNEDHTQLTIWIEPGRIKRGLGPNMELGPVLKKKNRYSLFISRRFRDENGIELDQNYTKNFVVGAADREKLNINEILFNYYTYDEFDYISVKFEEPVDFASSISNLKVTDSNKQVIAGDWQLTERDKEAIFRPHHKLEVGHYEVLLNSVIEDLAGNNFNRNFDQEISKNIEKVLPEQFILSFEVKYRD
jgi:hypothetical protein